MIGRPALLAVAHGTADPAGAAVLAALMERVRRLEPDVRVELAFVDHLAPSVTAALDELAGAGGPTAVVPLLLSAASHSKTDVAAAVQGARAEHPGWPVTYGRPLGPHPLLLAALDERLADAGAGPTTAVVLVAAGSADPDANADVVKVARLLWEWRGGGGPVEAAFATATAPSLDEVLRRLRRLGHDDLAVAPYFLAPGRLPPIPSEDRVRVAAVLGDTDELARLVLERYAEAVTGDLRMNCDVCRYRVPWPGRAPVVGAPQRPHAHPSDGPGS
ncbi:MAG: sirohydrochlorin chelatase [Actinomycetota bacterium]|nr:sirohydrochlorin chelatase [Actinomycetota bacterium]